MAKADQDQRSTLTASRTTIRNGDGTTFFDNLLRSTEPWPRWYEETPQVTPGADARPVPVFMAPGIAPEIQERWDLLWQWLKAEKKTRGDQTLRLQNLQGLLKEKREAIERDGLAPPRLLQQIEDLRTTCTSRFVADPESQLYACRTDMGLIFIHDRPSRIRAARKLGLQTLLFSLEIETFGPQDERIEPLVYSYVTLPQDQVSVWGEAAAAYGYLFALAPTE